MAPNGKVLEYFADTVHPEDTEFLGVCVGSCRSQSILEALAVLVALKIWREQLGGNNVSITLRADNMAALALSRKLSSSSPVLNFIGAELSLLLETMEVDELAPGHIYGATNSVADALSRLAAPECSLFLGAVVAAKKRECPVRNRAFYELPPPKRPMENYEVETKDLETAQTAFACPWSSRRDSGVH